MKENIVLTGKCLMKEDNFRTATIELEPPDLYKLEGVCEVLIKREISSLEEYIHFKEDIVYILSYNKNQSKEMPKVPELSEGIDTCNLHNCIYVLIDCVKDLQERIKKMEEKQ